MKINAEVLREDAYRLTGLDSCIIGYTEDGFLVYSYEKMLEHFMADSPCCTYEEAAEHIDFNILCIRPRNFEVLYEIG